MQNRAHVYLQQGWQKGGVIILGNVNAANDISQLRQSSQKLVRGILPTVFHIC